MKRSSLQIPKVGYYILVVRELLDISSLVKRAPAEHDFCIEHLPRAVVAQAQKKPGFKLKAL